MKSNLIRASFSEPKNKIFNPNQVSDKLSLLMHTLQKSTEIHFKELTILKYSDICIVNTSPLSATDIIYNYHISIVLYLSGPMSTYTALLFDPPK